MQGHFILSRTARYERLLLPVLMLALAAIACRCGSKIESPDVACERVLHRKAAIVLSTNATACEQFVAARCGDPVMFGSNFINMTPDEIATYEECTRAAANEFAQTGGRPQPPPASTPQTSVVVVQPQRVSCAPFRLTSPLAGMANGMQTFFWDALPNASGYRIQILENGAVLASFEAGADQTSLTADVSSGRIGGLFDLVVRAQALKNESVVCSAEYPQSRAATAPAVDNPVSQPVNTCGNAICEATESNNTCAADCFCGNFTCDAGEDRFTCGQDCGG